VWQWNIQNVTGNFQGGNFDNIYPETSLGANPAGAPGPYSPWPGTGVGGFICRPSSGNCTYRGAFPPTSAIQTAGTGSTFFYYYLVVHDTTASLVTNPFLIYEWKTTGSDAPVIPWARWANGADTITYDLIRTESNPVVFTGGAGSGGVPYSDGTSPNNGCPGLTVAACGSVVLGQAQCAGFVCSFTDNSTVATSNYPISIGTWQTQQIEMVPASYATDQTPLFSDNEPVFPIAAFGNTGNPTIILPFCDGLGLPTPGGGFDLCTGVHTTPNNSTVAQTALLLPDGAASGGSFPSIVKGRLVFTQTSVAQSPHHIITLVDSKGNHTKSVLGYRPTADTADCYLGVDQSGGGAVNQSGLSMGCQKSISQYINNVGDNINFLTRLTSTGMQFATPVSFQPFTATLGTSPITSGTCASTVTVAVTGTTTASVVHWDFATTPVGVTGYGTGSLVINTWATSNNANFSVCNPTGGSITPGSMNLNFRVIN
jgi:hypothetical protein